MDAAGTVQMRSLYLAHAAAPGGRIDTGLPDTVAEVPIPLLFPQRPEPVAYCPGQIVFRKNKLIILVNGSSKVEKNK